MMIEWWGPIIHEFYAGSEGNGFVHVVQKNGYCRGTVGKPIWWHTSYALTMHLRDTYGEEGTIWFEGDSDFKYHKDDKN